MIFSITLEEPAPVPPFQDMEPAIKNIIRHHIFYTYLYALLIIQNFRMQEGTVKCFNETKGFGFITPSTGGPDVFVHVSRLISEIRENDRVSYEVQNGKKGLNAVNVTVI